MTKKENMESKKGLMYVNPTLRSDKHVVFYLCSPSTSWKYSDFFLFYAF